MHTNSRRPHKERLTVVDWQGWLGLWEAVLFSSEYLVSHLDVFYACADVILKVKVRWQWDGSSGRLFCLCFCFPWAHSQDTFPTFPQSGVQWHVSSTPPPSWPPADAETEVMWKPCIDEGKNLDQCLVESHLLNMNIHRGCDVAKKPVSVGEFWDFWSCSVIPIKSA